MWYVVLALVDSIDAAEKALGFPPTKGTLEHLREVDKIAWRRYGVSMYPTLKDYEEILERFVEEGYLKNTCVEKDGISICRYEPTEKAINIIEEVNLAILNNLGYPGFLSIIYLKATSEYFQMRCKGEYERGSDVGMRCKEALKKIKDYIGKNYPEVSDRVGGPLAAYLLLHRKIEREVKL